MALIPVNPERRDPGHFRKKAEIGLSNVDNMSAAEFVNVVSEDAKIINNYKNQKGKIAYQTGSFYSGILRTKNLNSRGLVTVGLYDSSNLLNELAGFKIDFDFSTDNEDSEGAVNYIITCPDNDKYLKDTFVLFHQDRGEMYIIFYIPNLPQKISDNFFDVVGINMIEWTPGVTVLDPSEDLSGIVLTSGIELQRAKLDGPKSIITSDSADSLSVFDKNTGKRLFMNSANYTELEFQDYDYPSINGVPFIGKKGLMIGNEFAGRQITVPAFHKDSTKEGSGIHDFEVLDSLRKINLDRQNETTIRVSPSSKLPNDERQGYGLVRPSKYEKVGNNSGVSYAIEWLSKLGEDSDVVTVGMFKEFMPLILKALSGSTNVQTHKFYLEDSTHQYQYVSSSENTITFFVRSYTETVGSSSISEVLPSATIHGTDVISTTPTITKVSTGRYRVQIKTTANPSTSEREASVTLTGAGGQTIVISLIQEKYNIRYGLLVDDTTPVYGSELYEVVPTWENVASNKSLKLTPIVSSNVNPAGYQILSQFYEDLSISNDNYWLTTTVSKTGTSYTLKADAEENPTGNLRTGTIYLSVFLEAGAKPVSNIPFVFSQKAVNGYLKVDDQTTSVAYTVSRELSTKTVRVSSNYPWSVAMLTLPSWISLSGYSGTRPAGDSSLTFIIAENNSSSSRSAEITLSNQGGNSVRVKITQTSRTVYIDLDSSSEDGFISFNKRQLPREILDYINVKVTSNVNWFIDEIPTWLKPQIYDYGQNGAVTETNDLRFSVVDPDSTINESRTGIVSFSYLDEATNSIVCLRKLEVRAGQAVLPWKNSTGTVSNTAIVLPRTPLNITASSEEQEIEIKCHASHKYKLVPLINPLSPFETDNTYVSMIKGFDQNSTVESGSVTSIYTPTSLKFTITKNTGIESRSFSFILIPTSVDFSDVRELFEAGDIPVFTVEQKGEPRIEMMVLNDSGVTENWEALTGFFMYVYSGTTTNVFVPNPPRPQLITYNVQGFVQLNKGDVITSNSEFFVFDGSEINDISEVQGGQNFILPRLRKGKSFCASKDGKYVFAATENLTSMAVTKYTKKSSDYSCNSKDNEFLLGVYCEANNYWDVYNENIPGWINLSQSGGSPGFTVLNAKIDPNPSNDTRSFDLVLYADSLTLYQKHFQIIQSGIEVTDMNSNLTSVIPVSCGEVFLDLGEQQINLTTLTEYQTSLKVNGETVDYVYSRYQENGVRYEVQGGISFARIGADEYGKPVLIVDESTEDQARYIVVQATYNGKSGTLKFCQAGKTEMIYERYSDIEVTTDYSGSYVPVGMSTIGFTLKANVEVVTVKPTGETVSQSVSEFKVKTLSGISVKSGTGVKLSTISGLDKIGDLGGNYRLELSYPKFTYSDVTGWSKSNQRVSTNEFTLTDEDSMSPISIKDSMISLNSVGETAKVRVKTRLGQNCEIVLINPTQITPYLQTPYGNVTIPGGQEFELISYYNKKNGFSQKDIVAIYRITYGPSTGSPIVKYLYFKAPRALPSIEIVSTSNPVISYGSQGSGSYRRIAADVTVKSNIGYTSSAQTSGTANITNGEVSTSEITNVDSTRSVNIQINNSMPRFWVDKMIVDYLVLKDTDNYGYSRQVPLLYPGNYDHPQLGFGGVDCYYKKTTSPGNYETIVISKAYNDPVNGKNIHVVYDLELPNNTEYQYVYIRHYGALDLTWTPTGSAVTFRDQRGSLRKRIGSLDYSGLQFRVNSTNTGTSPRSLGTLYLKPFSSGSVTINLTQASSKGTAQITQPSSKTIILETQGLKAATLTFTHTHPYWFIKTMGTPGNVNPKFNNSNYSPTFGTGGNSGTNQSGTTTISLVQNDNDITQTVDYKPLEYRTLGEVTRGQKEYAERYGIITGPQSFVNSPSDLNVTDTFNILFRPVRPDINIVDDEVIVTPLSGGRYTFDFKLASVVDDFSERHYIGKDIVMDGATLRVQNKHTVLRKLLVANSGSSAGQSTVVLTLLMRPNPGVAGGNRSRQVRLNPSASTEEGLRFTYTASPDTGYTIYQADLIVTCRDFVIDNKYNAKSPVSIAKRNLIE